MSAAPAASFAPRVQQSVHALPSTADASGAAAGARVLVQRLERALLVHVSSGARAPALGDVFVGVPGGAATALLAGGGGGGGGDGDAGGGGAGAAAFAARLAARAGRLVVLALALAPEHEAGGVLVEAQAAALAAVTDALRDEAARGGRGAADAAGADGGAAAR